jgi:hypothetical protein
MFPAARQALMVGKHARLAGPAGDGCAPREGSGLYALLVDVAGQDENAPAPGEEAGARPSPRAWGWQANPKRDATALTVVEIDLSGLLDAGMQAPIYRVVDRRLWVGVAQAQLYGQLRALFEHWHALYLVVDATGVGAGLASFLDKALPGRVIPFIFSSSSKSKLGWDFLSIIETGRFLDWKAPRDGTQDERSEFWRQAGLCELKIYPGPEHRISWGVPDGTRDPVTGELEHDDLLLSAALVAQLEGLDWGIGASEVIDVQDPLAGFSEVY